MKNELNTIFLIVLTICISNLFTFTLLADENYYRQIGINRTVHFWDTLKHDSEHGRSYYTSTNYCDFIKIENSVVSTSVSNILSKLNFIYAENKWSGIRPKITHVENHKSWHQIKQLQNSLFEIDVIPVLVSNKWVDGSILATNGFEISKKDWAALVSLNWHELNENLNNELLGDNSATRSETKNRISDCRFNLYTMGYRVHFDRRFNLWRIVGKIDYDNPESNTSISNGFYNYDVSQSAPCTEN